MQEAGERERRDGEMDGGGEIHNVVDEGWGRREGDGPETWIRIHPTERIQQSHRKRHSQILSVIGLCWERAVDELGLLVFHGWAYRPWVCVVRWLVCRDGRGGGDGQREGGEGKGAAGKTQSQIPRFSPSAPSCFPEPGACHHHCTPVHGSGSPLRQTPPTVVPSSPALLVPSIVLIPENTLVVQRR